MGRRKERRRAKTTGTTATTATTATTTTGTMATTTALTATTAVATTTTTVAKQDYDFRAIRHKVTGKQGQKDYYWTKRPKTKRLKTKKD